MSDDQHYNDVSFDTFEEWGHDYPLKAHDLLNDLMERLAGESWDCTPNHVILACHATNKEEIKCDLTEVSFTVPQGKVAPCLRVEFTDPKGAKGAHRWRVHPDLVAQGPQAVWEAFALTLRKEAHDALLEVYDVVHALIAATKTERLKHKWPTHFHNFEGEPVGWQRADRGSVEESLETLQDWYDPEDG